MIEYTSYEGWWFVWDVNGDTLLWNLCLNSLLTLLIWLIKHCYKKEENHNKGQINKNMHMIHEITDIKMTFKNIVNWLIDFFCSQSNFQSNASVLWR